MKKFLSIAAAFAALVGCSKDASNPESAQSFVEGQTVTLSVSAPSSTKMSSKDEGDINFTWQSGDKVLVSVGEKTAEFTLKSGAGTSDATFEGKMPASGDSFDAQYPVATPVISSQTYSSTEAVPHDEMLFTAVGCTLDEEFKFEAKNAVLCLNLYGTDQTISKIDVKNTASGTITLNISGGKTLSTASATATPFYIVVPAGSYAFTAEIFDNASTPASICEFTPSAAKTFTNGDCLNMPAKKVKKAGPEAVDLGLSVYWADVNVGATNPEEYGTYFAWGDVTGQTWNGSSWSGGGFSTYPSYEVDANNNLKPAYDAANVNWGGSWRMPTEAECDELINNCTSTWTSNYNGTNVAGRIFTSNKEGYTDKSIFLPAAGFGYGSSLSDGGSHGHYWSATFDDGNYAWLLFFTSDNVRTNFTDRLYGRSVRPVTDY